MARLTKKAEILSTLHSLVEKEAKAQTDISGKPGVDTNITSISDETETTDKNAVGADKQNDKQKYEQKPSTDPSEPVAKAASVDVEKLAADILAQIEAKTAIKEATAQTDISGKPGADTNITSISDETETTDKNAVGADKQNDKQKYEQKPSTNPSEPVAKTAEELSKEASFKLGEDFAAALIKKAAAVKQAEAQTRNAEMLKEAGRRDFEVLIQQAALEIKTAKEKEEQMNKQAEEYGAFVFDQMLKQAQLEAALEEAQSLRAKLAEYQAFEKEAQARFEADQREQDFAKLASVVVERLKNELVPTAKQ